MSLIGANRTQHPALPESRGGHIEKAQKKIHERFPAVKTTDDQNEETRVAHLVPPFMQRHSRDRWAVCAVAAKSQQNSINKRE